MMRNPRPEEQLRGGNKPWERKFEGKSRLYEQKLDSRGLQGGRTHRDSAIIFGGIKNRNIDISMFFILPKLQKMPFLAVYRSVRATTQTNGVLMLG